MASWADRAKTIQRKGSVTMAGTVTGTKSMQADMKAALTGPQKARYEKLIIGASDQAPEWAGKYIKMAAPVLAIVVALSCAVLPYAVAVGGFFYEVYIHTPKDLLEAWVGFIFCFCGGVYPTLFAAVQAAQHSGWYKTKMAVCDIIEEAKKIAHKSQKDDMKDTNHDGKADVDEMSAKELVLHKTRLVMTKMDPAKVNGALGGLYMSWIGVMAVLKVQFARTVALALSICKIMEPPCEKIIVPAIKVFVAVEYHKWIPVLVDWAVKMCAMSIAWWLQRVLSAGTSALVGGLMITRSLMRHAIKHGYNLGGLIPKDHEDTKLDEILGWGIAFVGFAWQFWMGFGVPFPFNLFMWPIGILESIVQYQVTYA